MMPIGSIVDTASLLKTVLASLVAGVGITLAASIAIYGATRMVELRRDERPIAAGAAGALLALGLAVSVAGLVFGFIVMSST